MNDSPLTIMMAVYGAVVATAVLAWDVYKWKTSGRPKLSAAATGNFVILDEVKRVGKERATNHVSVKVSNVGDKDTTLHIVALQYYAKRPRWWRKQKPDYYLITPLHPSAPLPHHFVVGASCSCLFYETEA